MTDISESSRLFEASSRLQSAATALSHIRAQRRLDTNDREALEWAGNFLFQVDSTTDGADRDVTGDLSIQATDVRPSFYTALLMMEPDLKTEGIDEQDDLHDFLVATYRFLLSAGTDTFDSTSRLDIVERLVEEISKALLVRLTGNGVPSEPDSLQMSIG